MKIYEQCNKTHLQFHLMPSPITSLYSKQLMNMTKIMMKQTQALPMKEEFMKFQVISIIVKDNSKELHLHRSRPKFFPT